MFGLRCSAAVSLEHQTKAGSGLVNFLDLGPIDSSHRSDAPQDQERKIIEIPDDDSIAVRGVLRHIYRNEIVSEGFVRKALRVSASQYWLQLVKVAVKFLEPGLADVAEESLFDSVVSDLREASAACLDAMCDALYAMHELESRPKMLQNIVDIAQMAQRYSRTNERFRTYPFKHPTVMMKLVQTQGQMRVV